MEDIGNVLKLQLKYGVKAIPDLLEKSLSTSIIGPGASEGSCQKVLPEQDDLKSTPETSAVTHASRDRVVLQDNMITDSVIGKFCI